MVARVLEGRRLWLVIVGTLAAVDLFSASTSIAQTQQQIAWCVNNGNAFSPDLAINGCTAAIRSGRWAGKGLAWAFSDRGNAYLAAGDHDHAIADYSDAIRLDPKLALAFSGRSRAYDAKGDTGRAIADRNEAVRLDPKLAATVTQQQPKLSDAQQKEDAGYQLLNLFGDAFEHVRSDYVDKVDDWKLVEGAIRPLTAGAPSLASPEAAEKTLCADELASRGSSNQNSYTYKALSCFGNVFEHVRSSMPVPDTLMYAAIQGMVGSLDPRSEYFDPKKFRDMQVQTRGEFGGIGVEIAMEDGLIRVVAPIDGSSADKAGILANDIITQLDGERVQGLTLNQAVEKMRGPVNSAIRLTIMRKGRDKPIELSLTREVVRVHPVHSRVEGGDVGYIHISQFNEETTGGLKKAVADITAKVGDDKIKGYILDLRNNPGGLLDQAISVSDAFLESGQIVSTRGRDAAMWQRFNARPGDLTKGKPVIVLINSQTAAASEIVAGALQDHKRATIVGTRSFGNGTIQTIIPLGAGKGALRLTTARFFTPADRSIQDHGITPDIEVRQDVPDEAKKTDNNLQSYIPSDEKNDKALMMALDLLHGTRKNPAFLPTPKTVAPN